MSDLHPVVGGVSRRNRRRNNYLESGLGVGPRFEACESRLLLTAFVVTSAADSGAGTLREAITQANISGGADTISFNIAGGGSHTINLLSNLPAIAAGDGAVILDATTQPGYAGTPLIALNGAGLGGNGLILFSGNSTIKGLAIHSFGSRGIFIGLNGGNTIEANYIGTDLTGNVDLGNATDGIVVNVVGNNIIQNNVISGNNDEGIQFTGGSTGNTVQGNRIGTNAAGTADLGNTNSGITFDAAGNDNNQVLNNIISGNGTTGVLIGSNNITVRGNLIGTDITGTLAIANSEDGVQIASGASNNIIGGSLVGQGNTIAFNTRNGVRVLTGTGNRISGNSMFANGTLGIDLIPVAAGVTPNDLNDIDAGPNTLQNFPVITFAASNGFTTNVSGTLNSTPGGTFTIEFFSNAPADLDASGNGEGRVFLGSTVVTDGDLDGNISFAAVLAAGSAIGDVVTATATNAAGNTSEFSAHNFGGGGTTVVPSNLPPTANAGGPYAVAEGGFVLLDASGSSDPDEPTAGLTFEWDFDGDLDFNDAFGMNPVFFATGLDGFVGSSVTVAVRVTDNGLLTDTDTATITINNVAPVLSNVAVTNANEGGSVTLTGDITDPGTPDAFTLTIDWGNGIEVINYPAGTTSFSINHSYVDDDPTGTASDNYNIDLTLEDDDGGSDTDSAVTTISNVAPVLSNLAVTNANEGGSVTLTGDIADPGVDDPITLTIDWGNGIEVINLAPGTTSFSVNHAYADDDPTGTASDNISINVTIEDDDLGSDSDSVITTISNVAPVVAPVTGPTTAVPGQLLNYSSSFTDDGTLDTHTLQWEIKDSGNVVVASGGGLSINFTPTTFDTFTVTFTVTDDDTGSDSESLVLTVTGATLTADPDNPGDTALFVGGTGENEQIELTKPSIGNVQVKIRDRDTNVVTFLGTFSTVGLDRFVVYGLGGDDRISVSSALPSISAELYGGDGNDWIRGAGGDDHIDGGSGNDLIFGSDGRDLLVGGLGFDIVTGNWDDDILIGGVYTGSRSDIAAILAEWTSGNSYATRLANLQNGTGLNGSSVLNATTVFDDYSMDILLGLQGRDWFLADDDDDITDQHFNEVLTDIEIEFIAP